MAAQAQIGQIVLEVVTLPESTAVIGQIVLEVPGIFLAQAVIAQTVIELLLENDLCDCTGSADIMY